MVSAAAQPFGSQARGEARPDVEKAACWQRSRQALEPRRSAFRSDAGWSFVLRFFRPDRPQCGEIGCNHSLDGALTDGQVGGLWQQGVSPGLPESTEAALPSGPRELMHPRRKIWDLGVSVQEAFGGWVVLDGSRQGSAARP